MGWRHATLQEKGDFLGKIHSIEPHQRFAAETTALDVLALPFYSGNSLLLRCQDSRWRHGHDPFWYVLLPGKEIVVLDGSIANIHHLNFESVLRLTPESLPAYLKFRLYFGTDEEVRRLLVQTQPIDINMAGANFICECSFQEDSHLYRARLAVTPRGETTVLEKSQQAIALTEKLPAFDL